MKTAKQIKKEARETIDKNVNYDEAELGCNWGMEELKDYIDHLIDTTIKQALEGVEEWVKSWGAIPETDEYANRWNECRKELRQGYNKLAKEIEG